MKETNNNIKESSWDLTWEGYYLYCKNCKYEPSLKEIKEEKIDYCPKCKSKMTNWEKYLLKR